MGNDESVDGGWASNYAVPFFQVDAALTLDSRSEAEANPV